MSDSTGPIVPLLVDATVVAALLNVSQRHVHRMDALGQVPKPIRLGRTVRWNHEEIKEWIAAGAPRRSHWNLRNAAGAPRAGEQGR